LVIPLATAVPAPHGIGDRGADVTVAHRTGGPLGRVLASRMRGCAGILQLS